MLVAMRIRIAQGRAAAIRIATGGGGGREMPVAYTLACTIDIRACTHTGAYMHKHMQAMQIAGDKGAGLSSIIGSDVDRSRGLASRQLCIPQRL